MVYEFSEEEAKIIAAVLDCGYHENGISKCLTLENKIIEQIPNFNLDEALELIMNKE